MFDTFAETVVKELGSLSGSDLENKALEILDSGDFQGNIPKLKEAVSTYAANGMDDKIIMLMWNTANSGLKKKGLYR